MAIRWALPGAAAATSRTLTLRFGPVDPSGYATGTGTNRTPAPRLDGYVTRMHAHLVDARGRSIPQQRVMLHHVFFTNQSHGGHGDCAKARSQTFYGTGEEDQEIRFPAGYGHRVRRDDRWKVGWMFMNHSHTRDRVYLRYRVTVSDDPKTRPVTPYWISVSCARDKTYNVPGGGVADSTHRRSRLWTVPMSGRIVAAGAHAHGGALSVRVSRGRCGTLLSSDASYGLADDPVYQLSPVLHEPAPRSMGVVTSAQGWRVRKGDRLRVTSLYSDAAPHRAVMGIMHLYIAPGRGRTTPCPANPSDVKEHRLSFLGAPGRGRPPVVTPQLAQLDDEGVAQPLPGPLRTVDGDATPGQYRVFCSLHPVTMAQTIDVRAPD
jgi:hypothetical protein